MTAGWIGVRGGWVALGLLIGLSGCGRSPDSAIESVLNRCARLTDQVNRSQAAPGQAAAFLASAMQEIDTRGCPPDFRVAFQQHINAWREAAPYFARDTGLNAFIDGFAAGLLRDPSLFGASGQAAAAASQNINATYYRLASIAAMHGARVPNSVAGM
ncbi:MAG TPA: hypothetical protein PLU30_25555 [Verrucomicrobiae bacterium]|nr:hypothetical protein [Verrucomicrobiae bacterium]